MKNSRIIFLIFFSLLGSSAKAETYLFTGADYNFKQGQYDFGFVTPKVVATITTSVPIPANTSGYDIAPIVTHFSVFDGVQTLRSDDGAVFDPNLPTDFDTNPDGSIKAWYFAVTKPVAVVVGDTADFIQSSSSFGDLAAIDLLCSAADGGGCTSFSGFTPPDFAQAPIGGTWSTLQCTMYTDRAEFEAAAPGLLTEDFEKTGVISSLASPLDATTNVPPVVPGDILPGVTFSNPDFTQQLRLFDSMTPDGIILSTSNDTDGLVITFNPAVSAFGFDVFSERDSVSVRIYNAGSSVLLGSYDGSAPQTGRFLGCISSEPIENVTIDAPANASGNIESIDNVSFGEPSATPSTYTVGGTVSGLTGAGLQLQNGSETLAVAAAATAFTFTTELLDSASYSVSVSTQPTGQTCSVTNGAGAIAGADVTNVSVACIDDVVPTFSVGGTVSGLTGTGLELQNNGVDPLPIVADGPFTFLTELVDTTAYAVTISAQPTGQTCSVTDGSGTVVTADINNVSVACEGDVAPPAPAAPIPTLSQWALILFSTLLGLMVFVNRRRLF